MCDGSVFVIHALIIFLNLLSSAYLGSSTMASFSIDLRNIKTHTRTDRDKAGIIKAFENLLTGVPQSKETLEQIIYPATHTQYKKGI